VKRRLIIAIAAVAALAVAATGCSTKARTAGGSGTPASGLKTLVSGVLTIGTDMPYAPFESLDASGNPVGFDVEIFEDVARRLGYRTQWNNAVFDTIFTALGTKWDIVVSAVTGYAPPGSSAATTVADRSKKVVFGKAYYSSLQSFAVNTTKTPAIKSTDDLKSGDRVAVQNGTTGAFYAKEKLESKGIVLVGFDKAPDMFLALDAGTVKGIINDLPVSQDAVKGKSDLKVVQQIETGEQYAYAYAKDATGRSLRDKIDQQLDAIFKDGTYARIFKKFFPDQELPAYASAGTSSPSP
jgi:polar amino acid transport system substrate-binding protein